MYWYARHLCLVQGGPLAKEGSSATFCVLVLKASLPWYWGGLSAKVSSSAMSCVLECKASLLWYQGSPLAKIGSFAKFCVLVFKACLLWYWGDFQGSRNERKPLSKQKCVLRKCCQVSQKWWMLELSNFAIVFSTAENLLVGISGALGLKKVTL